MHSELNGAYPLPVEQAFCSTPDECRRVDVLFIGAGIGLACVAYLMARLRAMGVTLSMAVAEAGPFDLLGHVAHTRFSRIPFIKMPERMGGRLSVWGVSTPRPPEAMLSRYPYEQDDLIARFEAVEAELGVPQPIPMSGRELERSVLDRLGRWQGFVPKVHTVAATL
jgi:hypothetical protein